MRPLQQAVKDYLSLRRGLGFKLLRHERYLCEFVSFLKEKGTSRITTQLALAFATRHEHQRPEEWAIRLTIVRQFALYRSGTDSSTEVPPHGLLPNGSTRAHPYIYSEDEIRQLLKAARGLPSRSGLRPWTYYCLFGLLAVTGMRLGEAVNLQKRDVDWAQGILTIRDAKYGKCRLVPLHPSTQKILAQYLRRRDRSLAGKSIDHFFVSGRGSRLDSGSIHRVFYALSREVGLRAADASHGPRLHDLRHRFAVETLTRWYRTGEDVARRLPVLSTYLGHVCVTNTYWYLSNTPELMGAASKRLEKRWRGI
jgi:integrase/recombinase XerD